ncbi:MAG TPA: CDP-alcohol phosphatidyltransferase family protein [Gemmatimonadaceae bacterium]|jgi:cardiolipin synthase|nr:CDP-alcohol phosphatidyltransferase family protein [Gemmatimonadaceae bacterium]
MRREPFLTLPNAVSLSRFVMAAGFLAARSTDVRVALIGAASVSDILDGWIARRRGQVTRLGAMLDPIADRTFVLVAVMVYLARGEITRGQYFVLIARDLATAIGYLVARQVPGLRSAPFRARLAGKVVTILQLVTLVAVLVVPGAVPWLVAAVGAASAVSIGDYTLALWRARAA